MQVYFVATPIGNSEEISKRALEVLNSVDVIYCEDTRHSALLLSKYEIKKPLRGNHKFNEKAMLATIDKDLSDGKVIAVISDAGCPCISDPGNVMVNHLKQKGVSYTFVSGACALINAFALSGFDAPFTFVGFLPDKNIDRQRLLDKVNDQCTLIFYCSVHDVEENLAYLYSIYGDRDCCIARELTKLYESVTFGKLGQIAPDCLKGEFVVLLQCKSKSVDLTLTPEQHLQLYLSQGMEEKEAVKRVAKERNVPKNEIYKLTVKR